MSNNFIYNTYRLCIEFDNKDYTKENKQKFSQHFLTKVKTVGNFETLWRSRNKWRVLPLYG